MNTLLKNTLAGLLMFTAASLAAQQGDSTASVINGMTNADTSAATPRPERPRFGLFGGANVNLHAAQFARLSDNTTSPFQDFNSMGARNDKAFSGGVSVGVGVGLLAEIPLMERLRLGLRASYAQHNIVFTGEQQNARINGALGTLLYTANTRLSSVALEAAGQYNLIAGLNGLVGLRGGYTLDRTYVGSLSHTVTDNGFTSETSTLTPPSPFDVPATIMLSAMAGVSYDFSFSLGETVGSLILAPEALFLLGVNPVVSGIPEGGFWNLNQVRAGLAVKYESPEIQQRWQYEERIDTIRLERANAEESIALGAWQLKRDTTFAPASRTITESRLRTDTLIVPRATMAASVKAFGVDMQGVERPVALIRVEEFLANRYLPLLNYIFFDENSSDLHERYTQLTQEQVDAFFIPKLYNYEPLRAYQQILNIVGRRMYMYPQAKVTLTGCNAFFGAEKGALALSLRRAQAAREYLLDTWKIDSTRITVKARNLSENPSVPITEDDKIVENRRVEVTTDTPEILEWIVTPDTLRVINPPTIRFRLNARADNGIKRWRLTVQQSGTLLRNFGGDGKPPEAITWEFAKEERERGERIVRTDQPLEYTLTLTDKQGEMYNTDVDSLPVEQITIQKKRRELRKDKEFEQLSLILFEFDKAQLSDLHRRTAAFVKTRIKPKSEVEILGFTDRTGSADYNRKLSERRAKQISDLVKHPKTNVRGVGKDELLYTNDLPEGRYYCRTVTVTIETPIETP
jgi:outer membrane protein OmpA-like peptidoglycan-associated protein